MTIKKIRDIISGQIGKKVKIIYYGGRNKNMKFVGVIYMTYNNIFTIKQDSGEIKSVRIY